MQVNSKTATAPMTPIFTKNTMSVHDLIVDLGSDTPPRHICGYLFHKYLVVCGNKNYK